MNRNVRATLHLRASVRAGSGKPEGWDGGVNYYTDEPLKTIMHAVDIALADLRAQIEDEIHHTLEEARS